MPVDVLLVVIMARLLPTKGVGVGAGAMCVGDRPVDESRSTNDFLISFLNVCSEPAMIPIPDSKMDHKTMLAVLSMFAS